MNKIIICFDDWKKTNEMKNAERACLYSQTDILRKTFQKLVGGKGGSKRGIVMIHTPFPPTPPIDQ